MPTILTDNFAVDTGQISTFGFAGDTIGSAGISSGQLVMSLPSGSPSSISAVENSWPIASPNLFVSIDIGSPGFIRPWPGSFNNIGPGIGKNASNQVWVELGQSTSVPAGYMNGDILLCIGGTQFDIAGFNFNAPVTPDRVGFGLVGNIVSAWLSISGAWQSTPIASVDISAYMDFTAPGALTGWFPGIQWNQQGNPSPPTLIGLSQIQYVVPFANPVTGTTVPNVVGQPQASAESLIIAAFLNVGSVTFVTDPLTAPGDVSTQSPVGGTPANIGDSVDIAISTGGSPGLVPNVVGLSIAAASALIVSVGYVVGPVTASYGPQPLGTIVSQSPAAGASEPGGTPIALVLANGPQPLVMPNVVGETQAQALSDVQSLGVVVFDILTEFSNVIPAGTVTSQTPAAGSIVYVGTFSTITVSKGPFIPPLVPIYDPSVTVMSQFANSPTMLQLITNMAQYLRQDLNMQAFFDFVWNVETAQGFGLDIWGRIVDISRLLHIPNSAELFGFQNSTVPPGVTPFNFGVFNSKGGAATQTYLLPDDGYRILILAKALSNISATTAPAINQILQNLFPGRGNAFVEDLGGMAMQYTFQFVLTVVESAIIGQSNALPHGAGVSVSIVSM